MEQGQVNVLAVRPAEGPAELCSRPRSSPHSPGPFGSRGGRGYAPTTSPSLHVTATAVRQRPTELGTQEPGPCSRAGRRPNGMLSVRTANHTRHHVVGNRARALSRCGSRTCLSPRSSSLPAPDCILLKYNAKVAVRHNSKVTPTLRSSRRAGCWTADVCGLKAGSGGWLLPCASHSPDPGETCPHDHPNALPCPAAPPRDAAHP